MFLIISIGLIVSGCSAPAPGSNELSSKDYVAIYQEYHEEDTVIAGNGTIPFFPEPAPTPSPFDYDGSHANTRQYPTINDSLRVFYGAYKYYQTPATWKIRVDYGGVYSFPHKLESDLTIQSVDKDGTIIAGYNNQTVVLKIGAVWRSPDATKIGNQTFGVQVDNDPFKTVDRPFTVRYNSFWTVENKGRFDKSNLTGKV